MKMIENLQLIFGFLKADERLIKKAIRQFYFIYLNKWMAQATPLYLQLRTEGIITLPVDLIPALQEDLHWRSKISVGEDSDVRRLLNFLKTLRIVDGRVVARKQELEIDWQSEDLTPDFLLLLQELL